MALCCPLFHTEEQDIGFLTIRICGSQTLISSYHAVFAFGLSLLGQHLNKRAIKKKETCEQWKIF